MPEQLFAQAMTSVVAAGLQIGVLIFGCVSIARGLIGEHRRRRVILPTVGVVSGIFFSGLVFLAMYGDGWIQTGALVTLIGFYGYLVAAGLAGQAKDARA